MRPSEIRVQLVKRFGDHAVPPARTIENWVREDRSTPPSLPWRISMSPPEHVPAIFAALGAAIEASAGRIRWVSAAEADWIVRVSHLGAPVGLEPLAIYGAARRLARSDARDPSDHLEDLQLAIATELLPPVFGIGLAKDLRAWIDRGPDSQVDSLGSE